MPFNKPLPKPGAKPLVKPAPKPATTIAAAEPETRAVKSITTRLQPMTLDILDNAVQVFDTDRTDVLKRAIRLIGHCIAGHNTIIVITDKAGKSKEIPIVIDGVPT